MTMTIESFRFSYDYDYGDLLLSRNIVSKNRIYIIEFAIADFQLQIFLVVYSLADNDNGNENSQGLKCVFTTVSVN